MYFTNKSINQLYCIEFQTDTNLTSEQLVDCGAFPDIRISNAANCYILTLVTFVGSSRKFFHSISKESM